MNNKIGWVKNPLSTIAIFAGVSEAIGAGVLPFLDDGHQATYVWFLMVFPTLIVILFFATLNFNHLVLYAPSDYSDEDNFLRSTSRASPGEVLAKTQAEVVSEGAVPPADGSAGAQNAPTAESNSNDDLDRPEANVAASSNVDISNSTFQNYLGSMQSHFRIEEAVLKRLAGIVRAKIHPQIKVVDKQIDGKVNAYILDGYFVEAGIRHIVEIKIVRRKGVARVIIGRAVSQMASARNAMGGDAPVRGLLVLVGDLDMGSQEVFRDFALEKARECGLSISMMFFNLTELERNTQHYLVDGELSKNQSPVA